MSAYAVIACDVYPDPQVLCPNEFHPQRVTATATQTRQAAHKAGWHRTHNGRDICPDCWKAGHR